MKNGRRSDGIIEEKCWMRVYMRRRCNISVIGFYFICMKQGN